MTLDEYKNSLPDLLKNFRSVVDGVEMTGDHIAQVLCNIDEKSQPHEGFPLGALDRRVAVATTQLKKHGFLKIGRKGWEVTK